MVMKPEDRPKIIVMILAIVALFGYFFVGVLPRILNPNGAATAQNTSASGTPPATAPVATTPAASAPSSPPPAAGATPAAAGGAAPALPYAAAVRLASEMGPPRATSRDPFAMVNAIAQNEPNRKTVVPPLPGPKITDKDHGRPKPPVPPMPIAALATEPITLAGIMQGGYAPVAVVRIGERTVQKRAGDKLTGGLIIARITDTGILLKRGRETLPFIEIGGTFQDSGTGGATPVLRPMIMQ
jgi:hypothetical protein